jgi:hypothetical protein
MEGALDSAPSAAIALVAISNRFINQPHPTNLVIRTRNGLAVARKRHFDERGISVCDLNLR